MLIENLGADPVAPAANTGTIPAMPGTPALAYKPVEQARGWYTLYAYSTPDGKVSYYQWTFTPGVRPTVAYVGQKPYPPHPPMGQFPALASARAAMVAHLNMVSAPMPQQPAALQVYASPLLPTPEPAEAAFTPPPAAPGFTIAGVSIPPWALVAAAAGAVGLMIVLRGRKTGSRRHR